MARDPATGPIPPEKFRDLVNAPFGAARKEIRKYDPLWGREPGEKIGWIVTVEGTMTGEAYVEAASQEEADKLADKLTVNDIEWGYGSDDFTILSVEVDDGK